MQKTIIALLAGFLPFFTAANAQLAENFNDGDFTNNPAWTGNTADFTVNAALELQRKISYKN